MLTGILLLRITARVHPTLGCMGITPATVQEGTAGPCHLPAMEICCWQRRQQFWWLHFSLFHHKSAVCKCNLCARKLQCSSHVMVFRACAFRAHCSPAGTSGVLLDTGPVQRGGQGLNFANPGSVWESVGAAVLEACRAQMHQAALMLLVSFLFMWSELTPRILQS